MAVLADWQRRKSDSSLSVLEAGGGSLVHVKFESTPKITVVDISKEQLEKNTVAHEKILGDLCEIELGTSKFDMAVAWDVIEHLEQPRLVLQKLFAAITPGGIVVLAWPNPQSLRGMITKWSPHWFHVLVYKRILGYPNAGKPGEPPFKTIYHRDISLARVKSFAEEVGAKTCFAVEYERSNRQTLRNFSKLLGLAFDAAIYSGNLTTGRMLEATDIFMVLEKPVG